MTNHTIHTHTIKVDNTKVNRILIRWLVDTCIKWDIPFEIEEEISNGRTKPSNSMVFTYQNDKMFPISRNINKIQKRLDEKQCE